MTLLLLYTGTFIIQDFERMKDIDEQFSCHQG